MEVVYNEEKTKSEPTTPENNATTTTVKNKKGKKRSSGPSIDETLPTDEIQLKFQETDDRLLEIERTHNLSAHNVKSILNRVVKNPELILKFNLFSDEANAVLETTERSTRSKTKNDPVLNDIQFRPLNIPYCSLSHLSTEAFDYDESQDDDDIDYNPDNPVEAVIEQEPYGELSDSESSSNDSGSDILERESELDDSLMFPTGIEPSDSEESCQQPSTSYATRSRVPNLNPDSLYPEENDLTDFFDIIQLNETDDMNDKTHCGFSPLNIPYCRLENLNYDESEEAEDTDYNPQEDDVEDKDERIEEFRLKKSQVEIPRNEVFGLISDAYDLSLDKLSEEIPKLPRKRELKESKRQSLGLSRWSQKHIKPTAQDTSQSLSCSLLNKKQNEIVFLPDEYEQLKCQLEQHVQLLVQMVVVTHHTKELAHYRNEYQTKINLMEEYYRKFGVNSFFNISNLAAAIDTCHDINNTKPVLAKHLIWAERCDLNDHFIRPEACIVLSQSKAVLYPELVPTQRPSAADVKTLEFTVVDNVLLALGFVQYGHVPNAIGKGLAEFRRYSLISTNVLRGKTPVQIKDHMSRVRYQKNHLLYRLVAQCEDGNPQITFSLKYDRLDGTMDTWTKKHIPMWYKEFKERFKAVDKFGKTELQWIPPPDDHIVKKKKKDKTRDKLLIALKKRILDGKEGKRSRRSKIAEAHFSQEADEAATDGALSQEADEAVAHNALTSTIPASSTVEADSASVTSDLPSLEEQVTQTMEHMEPLFVAAPISPVPSSASQFHALLSTPQASCLVSSATTPAVMKTVPPVAAVATPVPAGTRFMVRDANGVCHFLSFGTDEVFIIDENLSPVQTNQMIVPCTSANQQNPEMTPAGSVEEFVIINEEKLNFENNLHGSQYETSLGHQRTPTSITTIHSDVTGTSSAPNILNDFDATYTEHVWDSPGADHALFDTIGAGFAEPKTPEKSVIGESARRQIFISPTDPKKARSPSDVKEIKISPAPSINSLVLLSAPDFPSGNSIVDESVSIWQPPSSIGTESHSEQKLSVFGRSNRSESRSPVPKRLRNSSKSPHGDTKEKQEAEEDIESSMDVASKSSVDVVSNISTDVVIKSRRKSAAPKKIIEKPKRTNKKSTTSAAKKTNGANNLNKSIEKHSTSENKENKHVLVSGIPNSVGELRTVQETDKEMPMSPSNVSRIEPSRDPRLRKRKRVEPETLVNAAPSNEQQAREPDSMDFSVTQDTLIVPPKNNVPSSAHSSDTTTNHTNGSKRSESRQHEHSMDSSDVRLVLPSTSSCSVEMLSNGSHSNMTSVVPRTPMPRAFSETSQISPGAISYSPINEDTNMLMMIPRTPRPHDSQSPPLTSLQSHQRLTSRLKSRPQSSQSTVEEYVHPFVSIYEDLERKDYPLIDIEEQQEGTCIASCDPEDPNLNKTTRVQKMKAGEEGMQNIDYRDKQKQLLSRKIWSDVRQRLSMHADTWSKVQAIVQEYRADPERQIAEFCDLLYEQHIECLMLLTVFAPADYLPGILIHHPLRKPYIDAFEMLMTIDSYAEHKKTGSARAYFRTLSKTDANCSSNDVCHHVRNVFGNDKPLWKKLKWFLPLAFDEDISQEDFENLDLTGPADDEGDLICEHLVLEPQFDVNDQNSNRNIQVIGEKLFLQKGGNTMEVDVHCLRHNEQEIFPSTSTGINPGEISAAQSLLPNSDGNQPPVHAMHQNQPSHIDTNSDSEVQTTNEASSPSSFANTWTKEDDLKLLNVYNNSEEDDQDVIASEAFPLFKYPLEEVANRLRFLLSMFD